ncbi:MAG: protein kinase [Bryobacteraceae bacterium]|nr:protein kinase [Bryobacteraceae bacterium]
MDSELLKRTDELFGRALRLPAEEREEFVRVEAQDQPVICKAVLDRLGSAETMFHSATAVFGEPIKPPEPSGWDSNATRPSGDPEAPPKGAAPALAGPQIPNLIIESLIAQGGMGAVYAGVQVEEGFHRKVAVKVVKPELASRGVMKRFLQERQVLASLDHPNIARLLEAGTTKEGTPFLVMEFVEGERIMEYCDSHKLDCERRLRLFMTVCEAVQYAHQRLVVHRDIKPGNIMVTAEGVPKLLDFGIAKLVTPADDETVAAALTAGGETPMTPMYASPEQVRNEHVTTSTDIYSLAILLYELLTGNLPYEFKQMTPAGIERTICETEPIPPSRAQFRRPMFGGETEQKLRKRLAGELDVILLTALRKEPARRYASVYQFADDIRRHLTGEPVLAHKDSLGYRAGKFVRRHKGGVLAATLAAVSLAASSVVSTYFAGVARQEKSVAERRFKETRELATYFLTDLDDTIRLGETKARSELVEKGLGYLKRLSDEAAGDVSLQKDVLHGYVKMGDILGNPLSANLGDPERARATYEEALSIGRRFAASAPPGALAVELALIRRKLADMDSFGGKRETALRAYREVETLLTGLDRAEVQHQIGWTLSQTGQTEQALEFYRKAMRTGAEALEKDPASARARDIVAKAAERVGLALSGMGDHAGAIENVTAALKSHEQSLAEAPASLSARRNVWSASILLGQIYRRAGRFGPAEESLRRAITISELLRKSDPANNQFRVNYFQTRGRLCSLLEEQPSKRAQAHAYTAALLRDLKAIVDSGTATQIETDQYVWNLLTTPFTDLRDFNAALPLAVKAAQTQPNDPRVLDMLALAHFGLGRAADAVAIERRALSFVGPGPSALRSELEENLRRFERAGAQRQ